MYSLNSVCFSRALLWQIFGKSNCCAKALWFITISVFLFLVKEECKSPKAESRSQKMSSKQVSFPKIKFLVIKFLFSWWLCYLTEFCRLYKQIYKMHGKKLHEVQADSYRLELSNLESRIWN